MQKITCKQILLLCHCINIWCFLQFSLLKSVHGKCVNKGRFACQVEDCGENFKWLMGHYQDKHNISASLQVFVLLLQRYYNLKYSVLQRYYRHSYKCIT